MMHFLQGSWLGVATFFGLTMFISWCYLVNSRWWARRRIAAVKQRVIDFERGRFQAINQLRQAVEQATQKEARLTLTNCQWNVLHPRELREPMIYQLQQMRECNSHDDPPEPDQWNDQPVCWYM